MALRRGCCIRIEVDELGWGSKNRKEAVGRMMVVTR